MLPPPGETRGCMVKGMKGRSKCATQDVKGFFDADKYPSHLTHFDLIPNIWIKPLSYSSSSQHSDHFDITLTQTGAGHLLKMLLIPMLIWPCRSLGSDAGSGTRIFLIPDVLQPIRCPYGTNLLFPKLLEIQTRISSSSTLLYSHEFAASLSPQTLYIVFCSVLFQLHVVEPHLA